MLVLAGYGLENLSSLVISLSSVPLGIFEFILVSPFTRKALKINFQILVVKRGPSKKKLNVLVQN